MRTPAKLQIGDKVREAINADPEPARAIETRAKFRAAAQLDSLKAQIVASNARVESALAKLEAAAADMKAVALKLREGM